MLIHLIQWHSVAFVRTKALYMMAIITQGIAMPDQPEWEARVKGLLKAELKRRNVTYHTTLRGLRLTWGGVPKGAKL